MPAANRVETQQMRAELTQTKRVLESLIALMAAEARLEAAQAELLLRRLNEGCQDEPVKEPPDPRVKAFIEWFRAEFKARRFGADYFVNWKKDGAIVKALLRTTDYERLQNLARILLSEKTEDPFIASTDRGIGILATKFNWLSDRLAKWEAGQKAGTA